MATYRAIAAVSSAIEGMIRDYYPRDEFDAGVQVALYQTRDFEAPMDNGFSVFLFHVGVNPTMRNLALRRRPDGRRVRPSLPLDLHYMVSTWATDVQMQHRMLGWVMRMLEDNSVLSGGHLNHYLAGADAFAHNEGLEIVCEPLSLADYLTLWDRLRPRLPVSATYRIRAVMLDSEQAVDEGPRVQSILVDGQGAPA